MARQPHGTRRQRAVRLGIPGSIVAVLAIIALWRVGAPGNASPERTSSPVPARVEKLIDVLAENTIGREASIDHVMVRTVTSARTFLAGDPDQMPVFVVVDPQVPLAPGMLTPGERVALAGTVRAAPDAVTAAREWAVDEATAEVVKSSGVYLLAREVRPAPAR